MYLTWFTTVKSFFKSIALHIILIALLVFSIEFAPTPQPPTVNTKNIVNAVSVDKTQVESELKKLKQAEENKRSEEKKTAARIRTES